ncbi:hypothetical protein [Mycoplasmoides alvi]|uniref:hypothetical protein n=1 Tax=Mycoplasmoides alvi TaxID=78580 RepID=UPI00051BF92D|nr:hypothetical protein [Mycoplasmoides alvi]
MDGQKLKRHACISLCPIIALLTLGIYPLVIGILLLVNNNKFENTGVAIATGVLAFVFFLPGWITSFCLKPKMPKNDNVN